MAVLHPEEYHEGGDQMIAAASTSQSVVLKDILDITRAYLAGRISYDVYRMLERQWYERYARCDVSDLVEDVGETQGAVPNPER